MVLGYQQRVTNQLLGLVRPCRAGEDPAQLESQRQALAATRATLVALLSGTFEDFAREYLGLAESETGAQDYAADAMEEEPTELSELPTKGK